MHGVTTGYRIDPAGAYVIGIAAGRAYHLRRGQESRIVRPGRQSSNPDPGPSLAIRIGSGALRAARLAARIAPARSGPLAGP